MNELQGDISVISEYLADPESFLSKYDLNDIEKQALINKDIDALVTLGLDQELAVNAMSAPWAHSQRCTARP
ncbi:arginine deiminase [Atopobacter sp. AH10]|nr:arginine deiminase [Atopobacter sp. AH10]